MRVTSSMYYKSLYSENNSQLNTKLFDVNKQIASGLKIQYAKDDVRTFTETMRLDNEVTTLDQIKKSTESGYKVSNQTDVTLNEFTDTMNRMRTLFINAANDTHSDVSLDAIADEMRIMEDHFKNLANTSINGQYLFSGSAVDIKPISDDGTYNGNDGQMNSFLGSNTKQKYNLSGEEFFLGEEVLVRRQITSNVVQNNLSEKYDFSAGIDNGTIEKPITVDDTIRDLMGDTDNVVDLNVQKHHFYLRGVQSDGTAFTNQISMSDEDSINELLIKIGDSYGNTPNLKVVNVTLNDNGQIVVEDKLKGSSKLDFHMTAAVDYVNGGGAGDTADITNAGVYGANAGLIDNLDGGDTDFLTAAASGLFVKEFVKSDSVASADSTVANIDGLLYDRTQFSKEGSRISSNIAQILKSDNSFAVDSTKLSEVADISKGTFSTADDTLDGNSFKLSGTNINGAAFDVQIDFATVGSTFTITTPVASAGTYDIFNVATPRVATPADDVTYKQLMDVMNMVVTDSIPDPIGTNINPNTGAVTTTDAEEYDIAVGTSTFSGTTYLSYDGKIGFGELNATNTKAEIAFHDVNSGDFTKPASVMSFNSNNALTIRDPKTDFFKELDAMITAVEDHKSYPDSSSGNIRNIGIQNAITKLDDLQEHLSRSHSVVGAQSNALTTSLERTEILKISTMTLRSTVIDTDLAEASLKLTQLTLNYQAMLSTVGKVSQLSLVNYL